MVRSVAQRRVSNHGPLAAGASAILALRDALASRVLLRVRMGLTDEQGPLASVCSLRHDGRPRVRRKELLHPRLDAVLLHLVEPDAVDARVLVLVLDLVAAFLDVDRHRALLARLDAEQRAALRQRERIAQAADAGGEIARRLLARIEVLVELLVARRKHRAVLPVDAGEVPLAVEPGERVAVAGDAHHVEAGPAAVALRVGAA